MIHLPSPSDLLGYISIACWLGAQLPQVLKNIRRQSCEGLSLPFLLNWLLGDVSNLIGCILTHQLPFQTWLATYSIFIDCTLMAQYYYYSGAIKADPSLGYSRSMPSASSTRRMSTERGVARYRTLSAVAANVAATAALAAQQDEQADQRRRRQGHSTDRSHWGSRTRDLRQPTDDEDMDENTLTALADSFHSERGHMGRRNRVSWSIERSEGGGGSIGPLMGVAPTQLPSTDSLVNSSGQGQPFRQDPEGYTDSQVTTSNRQKSKASRKAATMVFLSFGALFGFSTLASNGISVQPGSGKVLASTKLGASEPVSQYNFLMSIKDPKSNYESWASGRSSQISHRSIDFPSERIIGRVFAWLCTILYLTSRLPQIWKNFLRKSVEGLSMYLFIFALLGNTFYVLSILSSPRMRLPPQESMAFIKESVPYLLGSAGTLMFDMTIVAQSFIYRPRPRRGSTVYARPVEEETSLLNADPSDLTALSRGRTSRIRDSFA